MLKAVVADGLQKTQAANTRLTGLYKDALKNFEGLTAKAGAGARLVGDRVLENTEANAQATFNSAMAALRCTDAAELVQIQTAFMRDQLAAASEQQAEFLDLANRLVREMTEAATKVATDTVEQAKGIA